MFGEKTLKLIPSLLSNFERRQDGRKPSEKKIHRKPAEMMAYAGYNTKCDFTFAVAITSAIPRVLEFVWISYIGTPQYSQEEQIGTRSATHVSA